MVILALPLIIPRLGELKRVPRSTLAWLVFSGVAGRAIMVDMSLPLAAGFRVVIGLVCMVIVVGVRGKFAPAVLWPSNIEGVDILRLVLLITLSGWLPLVIYFRGLAVTRASTAG